MIQRRVLWLAVRMVDSANRERSTGDGVKVGGHQASSASLVTAMTALYFAYLTTQPGQREAARIPGVPLQVDLLGNLDRKYLTTRPRWPAGLPVPDQGPGRSRLLEPGRSVSARSRRCSPRWWHVDAHFGDGSRPAGDAELDEGNVWEAVSTRPRTGWGSVMWWSTFNRQSLDRVVPGVRTAHWRGQLEQRPAGTWPRPGAAPGQVRRALRRRAAGLDQRRAQRALVPVRPGR